jgi:hypothetical protein
MDRFSQVFRLLLLRALQFALKDLPRFLLHRAPIFRGADLELSLGFFRQFSDGDASHAINDIIAIIDCNTLIPPPHLDPDWSAHKSKCSPDLVLQKSFVGKMQPHLPIGEQDKRRRRHRRLRQVKDLHPLLQGH